MNPDKLATLLDTLDELDRAIETSDRANAQNCASFIRRLLTVTPAPSREQQIVNASLAAACGHFQIDPLQARAGRREPGLSARQLAIHFARQAGLSLTCLARHFNKRAHGSITDACRTIQNRIDTEPSFAAAVQNLQTQIPTLMPRP